MILDHIVDRRADNAGLEGGLVEILEVIDDDLRAAAGDPLGVGLVLRQGQRLDALRELGQPPVPGIEDDVRARGHVVEDLGDGATFVRAIAAIAQFLQDPVRPLPGSSPRATSSSIVSWRPFCAT